MRKQLKNQDSRNKETAKMPKEWRKIMIDTSKYPEKKSCMEILMELRYGK